MLRYSRDCTSGGGLRRALFEPEPQSRRQSSRAARLPFQITAQKETPPLSRAGFRGLFDAGKCVGRCPSARRTGQSSHFGASRLRIARGGYSSIPSFSNESWSKTHQWRTAAAQKQQRIEFAKSLATSPKIKRTVVGTACCQQAAILSRLTIILQTRGLMKSPSGQARCSRQHRRRGGEIRRKGADPAGVMPRFLPDSESRRRIPASCPFPRSLRRQLRATPTPLAASRYRPEA
jgi:hypothetical protein